MNTNAPQKSPLTDIFITCLCILVAKQISAFFTFDLLYAYLIEDCCIRYNIVFGSWKQLLIALLSLQLFAQIFFYTKYLVKECLRYIGIKSTLSSGTSYNAMSLSFARSILERDWEQVKYLALDRDYSLYSIEALFNYLLFVGFFVGFLKLLGKILQNKEAWFPITSIITCLVINEFITIPIEINYFIILCICNFYRSEDKIENGGLIKPVLELLIFSRLGNLATVTYVIYGLIDTFILYLQNLALTFSIRR